MILCLSVEVIWPAISLLLAAKLPLEDQALGSGLLQSVNNVGRALGLAVATAVQTATSQDDGGVAGNSRFLYGLRAAQWTNVGSAGLALAIGVAFFRRIGPV